MLTMDDDVVCRVPPTEGFLGEKEVLISAQCIKKEYPDTYDELTKGKTVLMGCPVENRNLDYKDKIMTLLNLRNVDRITVAMTEKTCSGCLRDAVRAAVQETGKQIKVKFVFVDNDGKVRS